MLVVIGAVHDRHEVSVLNIDYLNTGMLTMIQLEQLVANQ
jgi:hypothetical protein